ncbi:MAG: PAS domain S-box protein [Candidatus Omnitrophota bacterium]
MENSEINKGLKGEIRFLHDTITELEKQINELKETGKLLLDSETKFRRLFEAAQDGILILNADTGQIEAVNPFLTDMLGYSEKEFLGKRIWEVGAFKDTEASKKAFLALQTKEYIRYEDLPLERKDGKLIDVEFVSNVYKIGSQKVIQCNVRNVTDRKIIEKELQSKMKTLEIFNKAAVDRELRMVELKKKIQTLEGVLDK